MSCLAIMRGLSDEINNAPIVNGQVFIETDQLGTQDPSKYNKLFIDNNDERFKLGINDWDNIINKPFESVGDTLSTANGKLSIHTEWDRLSNKPFNTIGNGLNVDDDKKLNTDIKSFECSWHTGTFDNYTYGNQYIKINGVETSIHGNKYIEESKVLSMTDDTMYIFDCTPLGGIADDDNVDIYVSIWNCYPKKVRIKNNKCKVTFPPCSTPNTTLICRVYIKEV